jgi:hypothetical protein
LIKGFGMETKRNGVLWFAAALVMSGVLLSCEMAGGGNAGSGGDVPAPAEESEAEVINLNRVVDQSRGAGWSFAGGVLTLERGGSYTLTGTGEATGNRVVVAAGIGVSVTLDNVTIDVSGNQDKTDCAFDATGAAVNLMLAAGSVNTVKSGGGAAGIQVPTGAVLTITSGSSAGSAAGKLIAAGGAGGGAGIGGGEKQPGGTVTITGGTVEAAGGGSAAYGAAGIGGGYYASGGVISIGGQAVVNAAGSRYAAGIGGGRYASGGVIGVGGEAVVNALGGSSGAGIGGGEGGGGGVISIGDRAAVNATGGNYGAGIGAGRLTGDTPQNNTWISIAGGMVTATTYSEGDPAAAIGGVGNNLAQVVISGGTVAAYNQGGPGISGGGSDPVAAVMISGGTIIASDGIGGDDIPTVAGLPVIFATAIAGGASDPDNGIALGDGDVHLYFTTGGPGIVGGTIGLQNDFTIPTGAVLTIPAGWVLNCNGNKLTENGTLVKNGTVNK